MKGIFLGILICSSCIARSRDDGRMFLNSAAQCIATKGFLPPTKATKMTFGYLLDEKSDRGEKVLYVVTYPNPSRLGAVFTVVLTEYDGRLDFNIQNNARFTLSKDGKEVVSFVTPPLGGTWTQEHLVSAIRQIEHRQKVTISAENLVAVDSLAVCEAYTDPQPKRPVN